MCCPKVYVYLAIGFGQKEGIDFGHLGIRVTYLEKRQRVSTIPASRARDASQNQRHFADSV